ncbi:MAG TPA: peptidoglycan DD-metalloendopeptidase family protein [Halanaerobiales bacterium]|nr:peptidoglycan DD-metalloendopeptidase family protein [Halanaerobiales bacterium]
MESSLNGYLKLSITLIISILLVSVITTNALAIGLELDDRGDKVREVQTLLKKVGYDISTDGIFGHNTKEIVKDFQLNNNLKVDGIVGDNTYSKLKKMAEDIKYVVKKGDTLYGIAKRFDTTVETIRASNNLRGTMIHPGDTLYIPKTGRGGGDENRIYANIIHEVQPGDALLSIAKKYGVDVQTIKQANNLNSNMIRAGENLVIPFEERVKGGKFTLGKGAFIWPLQGRISSYFGWRNDPVTGGSEFHKGLDIAVPLGTQIRAAASGEVVKSGWMSGFGKTIVIDHGEGVETIYAHNSQNHVRVGEQVNTGQIIGRAGSTGKSTGSHLHFGVMVDDKAVNPTKYLP